MVTPSTTIQFSDLQALATLANAKLSPATPYSFPAFAGTDQIGLPDPASLTIAPTYSPSGNFLPGDVVTLWLFAYKTIAGVKTYSYEPVAKAFYSTPALGNFTVAFTWTPVIGPTSPDGFIAVSATDLRNFSEATFNWKDIGNVATVTMDGSFTGWSLDQSYIPAAQIGGGTVDVPCAHGIWGKVLNTIWHDALAKLDVFGGAKPNPSTYATSGPWIISAGPKLYLNINNEAIYNGPVFVFSPHDSATGNVMSHEADMGVPSPVFTAAANGANALTWDTTGTISGTVTLLTTLPNQTSSDWTLSASDGSITTSIANTSDALSNIVTGLIFTFTNTPVTGGSPITLTATALTGGVIQGSGVGSKLNAVLTGIPAAQTNLGQQFTCIHPAGPQSNSAQLANTLPAVNLTTSAGGANSFESHWRAYCNGVYIANTLPTQGIMPFVDVDLPNYFTGEGGVNASRQRVPKNPASASYIPTVDNSPSLWPIFKDSDFTPDVFFGQPFKGSKAWNIMVSKQVNATTYLLNPVTVPANGFVAPTLPISPSSPVQQFRALVDNPNIQLYVKYGAPPTLSVFDAILTGGIWNFLTPSSLGWVPGGQIFVGFFNTIATPQTANAYQVGIDNETAPNGNFFAGQFADDGSFIPFLEGQSYIFDDPSGQNRPIPLFGYSIFKITLCRLPGADNSQPVNVNVGVMDGSGWAVAGTFDLVQSFSIPAGQDFIDAPAFIPVLGGAPLAYQTDTGEDLIIAPQTNFQPMMNSGFDLTQKTFTVGGSPSVFGIGYYDGHPFYNPSYSLFFPDNANIASLGVVLPQCAARYNDLTTLLNAF